MATNTTNRLNPFPARGRFSRRTESILRATEYALLLSGIIALFSCAYLIIYAKLFQAYQSRRFDHRMRDLPSVLPGDAPRQTPVAHKASAYSAGSALLGRIKIPRLNVSAMILDGVDDNTLWLAVGHIPGTAFPGEPGNVALAGHRDTFFRGLREIRETDEITVSTSEGTFRYRVDSTEIVKPKDVLVLRPFGHPTLTLVTCYPFDYLGSAPKRFVVTASQISVSPQ